MRGAEQKTWKETNDDTEIQMENDHNKTLNQEKPSGAPPRPSLTIDYDLYWHYLENSDLTDEQKRSFLDDLWVVIISFVEMGIGVYPLQQVTDLNQKTGTCEQNALIGDFIAAGIPDVLNCASKSRPQSDKNNDVSSGPSKKGIQS